jgi:hypothetical protein
MHPLSTHVASNVMSPTSWKQRKQLVIPLNCHLSKNNEGCVLVGTNTSNNNKQKQQHINHNFISLYFIFVNHHIFVVLRSNVRHIDGWNHANFMHKSNYTSILVTYIVCSLEGGGLRGTYVTLIGPPHLQKLTRYPLWVHRLCSLWVWIPHVLIFHNKMDLTLIQ